MKWNEWTEENRRHANARAYHTFTLEPSGIPVRDSALVDIVVELAGNRIETHLHVFASLAFLASTGVGGGSLLSSMLSS